MQKLQPKRIMAVLIKSRSLFINKCLLNSPCLPVEVRISSRTPGLANTTWVLVGALLIAVAPYFWRLGQSTLWDTNEAFYAQTPREMIQSGDYVNPTFDFQPRFNKPPLTYWVVAFFYKLFGVSEKLERVPIALGALVMIVTAYTLGQFAFSGKAGLVSAIAMAANPRFLLFARRIAIDVWLSMFMALALLFFAFALRYDERSNARGRRFCLISMYAAIGLGTMTKGPVAIALPALAFFVYLAISHRFAFIKRAMIPVGIVIVIAIVLPWYLAVYAYHGWGYIQSFVLGDNLSRYTEAGWGPRRSVFFYGPVLLADLFPWSIFLLVAGVGWLAARARAWRPRRRDADQNGTNAKPGLGIEALLAIWFLVVVGFFSLSKSKEDLYALPVYPAASALTGGIICEQVLRSQIARMVRSSYIIASGVLFAAGAALLYLDRRIAESMRLEGSRMLAIILLGGGAFLALSLLHRHRLYWLIILALVVGTANWVIVLKLLPDYERFKPVSPIASVLKARAGPRAKISYYNYAAPSLVYYLNRRVVAFSDDERIRLTEALGSGHKEFYCLTTLEEYRNIEASLGGRVHVLARQPIYRISLKSILTRSFPSEVVLISNRE